MSHLGSPGYDFTLTFGGNTYGYMLYTDPETGQKHWNEGLAPLLTPQQRITEFSYEHIPPEIDVPVAFEDWSDGAGFVEHSATQTTNSLGNNSASSNSPRGYNYSQGLDLSWGNRIYVSPERVSVPPSTSLGAIALGAAPARYWYSTTFGLWMLAGHYLWKYDLTTTTWVLKLTGTSSAFPFNNLAELNGVLYLAVEGDAYRYSTDGDAWTVATLAGGLTSDIADLFVTRNNGLWAMRNESLYTTTNGQNGGVNWSAATIVGSTSEQTNSMVTVNADIWIFKREGVYIYDGTTVSQVYTPTFISSANGKHAYVHSDGNIYVVYENAILAIDPFGTTVSPIHLVYPKIISEEIKGTVSQITGTFSLLYFTVTNPDGRTYLMKLDPDTEVVHTYAYLGSNTSVACMAVGEGVAHATNPCVLTGYGNLSTRFILPRSSLRPEDDEHYRYDTTAGVVYGPWLSFGARAFDKFLNRGTVLALNVTAGQPAALAYAIDDSTTDTTILTAVDPGLTQANVTGTVEFNRVRYKLTANAVSNVQSPIVVAATLHATLNPPRRRLWKPLVDLAPGQLLRGGSKDTQDTLVVREALFSGVNQRITMVDRNHHSFTVRLLDIQEQQIIPTKAGGRGRDNTVFQLAIAEISPLVTDLPTGIYGDDTYGGGKVWA